MIEPALSGCEFGFSGANRWSYHLTFPAVTLFDALFQFDRGPVRIIDNSSSGFSLLILI